MNENIFINAINAKSGGGKSILTNFIKVLSLSNKISDKTFFFLVPNYKKYEKFVSKQIHIVSLPQWQQKTFLYPLINTLVLPRLVKKLKCELIFNLSDVPMPIIKKQILLFDWPYAAFLDSTVWKRMTIKDYLIRRSKLFLFKKNLRYLDLLIAQTNTIKKLLSKNYNIKRIKIVPNAVSIDNLESSKLFSINLPYGFKLLCLTKYYTHKNIEIFIPLAKEILNRKLNIKIITTLSSDEHPKAKLFLKRIKNELLESVIINLGPIDMKNVPSIYKQTDGLLLPTLLESFSGTYAEALFHQKPIFTSNLDFAVDVCKSAAYYFDPLNHINILETIISSINNPKEMVEKINIGKDLLNEMPSWEQNCNQLINIINSELKKKNENE